MSGADSAAGSAARMDAIYRYQRHIYDATRRYYLLGRDRLLAELAPPRGGSILEIGCGTGRNLVHAARLYPDARLYGLDLSSVMLESAAATSGRAGLSERIALAQGDAASFDPVTLFGRREFDRVVLSYTLSMIPPWRAALSTALDMVVPGGRLHVVDFGRQQGHPAWARNALRRWLSWFSVDPRDDLQRAMATACGRTFDLSFEEPLAGYYAYAVARRRPAAAVASGEAAIGMAGRLE
jgi:S-adenosylmethionine-diacylgycerolhomoserine-N-methlytransferase